MRPNYSSKERPCGQLALNLRDRARIYMVHRKTRIKEKQDEIPLRELKKIWKTT